MMSEQQNVQAVQAMYAAFGNGDIPGLLAYISEDIVWQAHSPTDEALAVPFQGHAGVLQFFQLLDKTLRMDEFEPKDYIAQGDRVVALGHLKTTHRETGEVIRSEFAMLWTLKDGKAVRFFEYGNDKRL
jgi:ketosteroid isomerase-like protein